MLTSLGKVGPHLKKVAAYLGGDGGVRDGDGDDGDGGDGDGGDGDDGECSNADGVDGVFQSLLNLSFSRCETTIVKNSLVPIRPAAGSYWCQYLPIYFSFCTFIQYRNSFSQ